MTQDSPSGATDDHEHAVLERIRILWVERPHTCFYALLLLGLAIALTERPRTPEKVVRLAGLTLATATWIHLWIRDRRKAAAGHPTRWTVPLSLLGAVTCMALLLASASFMVLVPPIVGSLFITLPLGWALTAVIGVGTVVDITIRRLATSPPDDGVLLAFAVVRVVGICALGIVIKTLVAQNEQRRQLIETLADTERRAGMLEERQRLAREIHDTLAQGFAGIVVHLEAAELASAHGGGDLRANLRSALDVARDSLVDARQMMGALHPELLERRSLPDAVRRVCDDWTRRSQVECGVTITGSECALHPDVEVTILRATQEALANVRKHAEARLVHVTLSYMDEGLALDIRDDGRGLAPHAAEGFGLRAMRERVALLGGTMTLESGRGEGTTVAIALPCAGSGGIPAVMLPPSSVGVSSSNVTVRLPA